MRRAVGHLTLAVLSLVASFGAKPIPSTPTDRALRAASTLRGTRLGVDHEGNLWAWDKAAGAIDLVSLDGARRSLPVPAVGAAAFVDVDSEWGVAGVFGRGQELRVFAPDGRPRATIALPDRVRTAIWLGPDRVAVSPMAAGYLAEVWSIPEGRVVGTVGSVPEIPLVPGRRVRTRVVFLRKDFASRLLYALQADAGKLDVFEDDSRLAWSALIRHPDFEDEPEPGAGKSHDTAVRTFTVILWDGLGVDDSGNAWLLEKADHEARALRLVKVSPDGSMKRTDISDFPCTAYRFAIWRNTLVVNRDPESPRGPCIATMRLP